MSRRDEAQVIEIVIGENEQRLCLFEVHLAQAARAGPWTLDHHGARWKCPKEFLVLVFGCDQDDGCTPGRQDLSDSYGQV
jgi:hypothetical protein